MCESKKIKAEQVIIKMPVTRQWWELSHDDIEITKKLGEGAFGEVSMGIYRPKPDIKIKVAIKQVREYLFSFATLNLDSKKHFYSSWSVLNGVISLFMCIEVFDFVLDT